MNILNIEHVSKVFGEKVVLDDLQLKMVDRLMELHIE